MNEEKPNFRPFDLYVLGPFLIWYGLKSKTMPRLARKLIVSAGIWQMYYNMREYEKLAKLTQEKIKLVINDTNGVTETSNS